ncbi:Flp pilus assembly protein TadB [Fontibacillus solani]|uniref:Flp pilus assembly protein TadB n=1 Tax=Fontibacillus solani TaxID=1572857 RepID=A0A7W3XSG3_9BACL|nr:hypothetical protein [Fontibacillus solani]MBA9086495.1 Flp pilus assembly protein TadB [Fontibacillus solani]
MNILIYSVLIATAAVLVIIPMLQLILPGFERQKRVANIASHFNKTEAELLRLEQNAIVRSFGDRLQRGKWMEFILRKKRRKMYDALGQSSSYEYYMALTILKSFIVTVIPIFFVMVTKEMFFAVMAPLLGGGLFYLGLRKIKFLYQQRQNQIIRDLPNLISKMCIALEVGQPLAQIFQDVSKTYNPILSDLLKKLIANSNVMPMTSALQLFAQDVDVPVMNDFISVVNVIMEKGFHEAEADLRSIETALTELRRLSLVELTKGNPEKMNFFYMVMIGHVIIFFFLMVLFIFGAMNSL